VLTHDFVDENQHPTKQALDKTLHFLSERLRDSRSFHIAR